nr:mucin-17-like [Aedes albopictus]
MPETDRFDCKLCQRSNNVDDMVFCAVCQEWYHYQCVGVTSAIANESWMCARCAALPSSTRIGELSGSDLVFPATNVNVSSTMTTDPPLAAAPNSSVVTIATNSGLTLAGTAAFSTTSSTVPPGLAPPAVAGPSGRVPATMISTTTTNFGQPLLTEQARASLQWVQEHRAFLEQQLEESHKKELERKKAMLSQLANNALQGVISGAASNSFNEQSAAVGVGNVGGWLGRMIDEMDNLSITPVSTGPQVTTPVTPVFNNSSTPTTAGSANQYVFDPSFSSLMFGVPSAMSRVSTGPVSSGQCSTTPSIPLYGYSPPGGDHSRQISAFPISTQVSSMDLRNANMTNVVTACPTIPTVSIPQPSVYGGFSVNASAPRLNQNPIVSQAPVGGYYPASSALPSSFPCPLRLNWALYKQQLATADLRTFAGFMSMLVAAASDVTVTTDSKQPRSGRGERGRDKNFLNAHAASEPTTKQHCQEEEPRKSEVKEVLCLACDGRNHKVKDCATFKRWDVNSRWKTIQDHSLCRTCLGKHGRRPCKIQTVCGVEGCQQRHHQLLHSSAQKQRPSGKEGQNTIKQSDNSGGGLNAHRATKKSTLFRIVPVKLSWKGKSVQTYAFLDDGSDMTLVEQSIAERLGIDDGEPIPLCLTWTSNVTRQEPKSQRIRLEISGEGKNELFALHDARTVSSLNLPKQTLNYGDLARKYTYLRGYRDLIVSDIARIVSACDF